MPKSLKELLTEKDPKDVTMAEYDFLTLEEKSKLMQAFFEKYEAEILKVFDLSVGSALLFCDGKVIKRYTQIPPNFAAEAYYLGKARGKVCYPVTYEGIEVTLIAKDKEPVNSGVRDDPSYF